MTLQLIVLDTRGSQTERHEECKTSLRMKETNERQMDKQMDRRADRLTDK